MQQRFPFAQKLRNHPLEKIACRLFYLKVKIPSVPWFREGDVKQHQGDFPFERQPVALNADGLSIDGMMIVRREQGLFVPKDLGELLKCFERRICVDIAETRLEKIATLLNEERYFEAIFLANLGDWVDPESVEKANFNQAQPRDHRGWWTKEPSASEPEALVEEAEYRGFFHDVVVDDLLRALSKNGSRVLKNVNVLGLNGILSIPGGLSRPEGWVKPYFIEVKTGNDPDFTSNQNRCSR